jgi:hypothetical protein
MAHFAELDSNNIVLRVVTACNIDIANNGGEQSEQAANHFASQPANKFSENGVKWVQTSYNNNFRKQFAGMDFTYDPIKDKFISPQRFSSWSLDFNDDWKAPVEYPNIVTYGLNQAYHILWDEENLRWLGYTREGNEFLWFPQSNSWVATGN